MRLCGWGQLVNDSIDHWAAIAVYTHKNITVSQSKLHAHNMSIIDTPKIITDCAPCSNIAHLHTTLTCVGPIDQSHVSIRAGICNIMNIVQLVLKHYIIIIASQ